MLATFTFTPKNSIQQPINEVLKNLLGDVIVWVHHWYNVKKYSTIIRSIDVALEKRSVSVELLSDNIDISHIMLSIHAFHNNADYYDCDINLRTVVDGLV